MADLPASPSAAALSNALDKRRVRARFEAAAGSYDTAAVLQRTVADRLVERLDVVRKRPASILDAGCGTGYCTRALARRYPRARVVGADLAWRMASIARRGAGWLARSRFVTADAEGLPFADAAFELVLSNFMLPWCRPATVFAEMLRVLQPDGLFVFTTLGPDTLQELRGAWQHADPGAEEHAFLDMHDVGDALVRAGFIEPVMDVERITLTYPDLRALFDDLKALGARGVTARNARGLIGKERFARFRDAYEAMRRDGRLPATCEVVYGHAWAPRGLPGGRRVVKIKSV